MKRAHKLSHICFPVILLLTLGLAGCGILGNNNSDDSNDNEEPNEEPPETVVETTWYKGSLHAHSYWNDGQDYPEMILNWYKDQGYNFAVLSGHNTIQEGEKSIEVEKGSLHETIFQQYLNEFGEEWVEDEETDSLINVTLKSYEEYSEKVNEDGSFLAINGEEIDYRDVDNGGGRILHVNVINVQELIQPPSDGGTVEILQEFIDAVQQQSSQQGIPMLAQINHPNINTSISADDLKQLKNVRFFEVYCGHPSADNRGDIAQHNTDEIWDEVLTHYILNGKDLLYGTATDDSHLYHTTFNGPGKGWIQVRAEELSAEALISAMNKGDFYASTGVELSDIQFDEGTLSVSVAGESGVNYTIQFIGTRRSEPENTGIVLAETEGTEASYTLKDDDLYVRAKIISDKPKENASAEGEVEVAWVQPVTQ